jgi:branched-subunit amino acid transport protein
MSVTLVALAVLMGAVTYPSRAVPLLTPGIERLPAGVRLYLRLVGPAVLAALAAANAMVASEAGHPVFHIGIEWLAVAASVVLVAWRRNLFAGLLLGVVLTALARATGLA